MEWIEYSRHVSDWETKTLSGVLLGNAHVRNRRTAGEERRAARAARRADGADAHRHDRARAGFRGPGGVHASRWREAVASSACTRASPTRRGFDWQRLVAPAEPRPATRMHDVATQGNHAVLDDGAAAPASEGVAGDALPRIHLLSVGRAIDLYKDIGTPARGRAALRIRRLHGTHLVGHTRMATESAVTPERAHPFTAGEDFCLVHNGSLSNPYSVRRKLEPLGIALRNRQRHRGRVPLSGMAAARRRRSRDGAGKGLRRARRLLHVSDGHAGRARAGARCVRLQAGHRRRDRRLRRDLVGIPLARASARRQERAYLRAEAGADLRMDRATELRSGDASRCAQTQSSSCTIELRRAADLRCADPEPGRRAQHRGRRRTRRSTSTSKATPAITPPE